jgi:hypothetical protein
LSKDFTFVPPNIHLLPSFDGYASFPEIADQLSLGIHIRRTVTGPNRHAASWGNQPQMAVAVNDMPALSLNFPQYPFSFVVHFPAP